MACGRRVAHHLSQSTASLPKIGLPRDYLRVASMPDLPPGKLRLAYAGWDDTRSFRRTAAGKLAGGWKGGSYPPAGGSDDPPSKTRTPLRPPLVFPAIGGAHVHRTVHFSPSFLTPPSCVTAPSPLCVTGNQAGAISSVPAPPALDRLRDLLVLFRHLREAVLPQASASVNLRTSPTRWYFWPHRSQVGLRRRC